MSIADKLTYLDTTKQLLKTEINKIKNVLDDNSTFRSYPQELFNGYLDILNNGTDTLWNNLEKVSATGEEATLENVETAPMKIELSGNTSQDGTPTPEHPQQVKVVKGESVVSVSGKNLLGLINGTYSHNGITAVVNDGTITIKGTATANSFVNIPLIKDIVLSNEQVTASINNATTISDTATEFRVYESGNNYIPVQFTTINRKTTTTKTGTFVSAYVRTSSGVSYDNELVIKPQLELGNTASEYTPFSKTDYPIDLTAKNIFDKDNANILNAWINASTKVITGSNSNRTIWVEAEENTTYKVKKIADTSSNGRFRVGSSPNPPVAGGTLAQAIQDDTAEEITITTSATDKYIAVFCYNTSSSITLEKILASLEIEEANISYAEMCKIDDNKDYLFKRNGKWYVHKEIGKKVFDGSETWRKDTRYFNCNASLGGIAGQGYTNYYKYGSLDTLNNFVITTNAFRVNADFETLEDYKNWLSTHNVILYYQLATPTEEEITNTTLIEQLEAIYKAKSVKDKTYITQINEELPFVLDVEAIKEYNVE